VPSSCLVSATRRDANADRELRWIPELHDGVRSEEVGGTKPNLTKAEVVECLRQSMGILRVNEHPDVEVLGEASMTMGGDRPAAGRART